MESPVDPAAAASGLWMIIALPLAGAVICGLLGKPLGRANIHQIALGSVGGSFLLSLWVYWSVCDIRSAALTPFGSVPWSINADLGTWFRTADFTATFGLSVDHLSGVMLLVVTGVGFLIHLYSTEYMSHDAGYWRYFAYLNLFVAAMLTLVLADSLLLLFIGWEGVGLCSYLLIGFWYEDKEKAFAGRKAFIVNRIGDLGFIIGAILLILMTSAIARVPASDFPPESVFRGAQPQYQRAIRDKGPLAFSVIEETAQKLIVLGARPVASGPLEGHSFQDVTFAILLLFLLGAAGKSAQIPLYVWLPDAMAGPTPVSALIHAATMVTSGVYLFCRLSFFLVLSPAAMATIAVIGATTALFAALIAFSQTGLKKVLAYSTVSQLGLMFLGVGVGAFWAAFLHLVTHAFFKACLFLGAGSVMHGNADEEDITKLGGLRHTMPYTWATFLIATLAITGIVPLSGFFSKDAILHGAHTNHLAGFEWAAHFAYIIGSVAAFCTAFYMIRLYVLAFVRPRSRTAKTKVAHESGKAILVPLIVLATLAVVSLVHGLPILKDGKTMMEAFLSPVFRAAAFNAARLGTLSVPEGEGIPWGAFGLAWAIALAGGGAAWAIYRNGKKLPDFIEPFRRASFNKFYVDEVYDLIVVRPLGYLARVLYRVVDMIMIDGMMVRGSAWVTSRIGGALRYFQTGDAQLYAAIMVVTMVAGMLWVLVAT